MSCCADSPALRGRASECTIWSSARPGSRLRRGERPARAFESVVGFLPGRGSIGPAASTVTDGVQRSEGAPAAQAARDERTDSAQDLAVVQDEDVVAFVGVLAFADDEIQRPHRPAYVGRAAPTATYANRPFFAANRSVFAVRPPSVAANWPFFAVATKVSLAPAAGLRGGPGAFGLPHPQSALGGRWRGWCGGGFGLLLALTGAGRDLPLQGAADMADEPVEQLRPRAVA